MPIKGEMGRKLKAVSHGEGVRPPKRWFKKILDKVTKQYPGYTASRKYQIVGGIWSSSSISTKKKIIRKYQRRTTRKSRSRR